MFVSWEGLDIKLCENARDGNLESVIELIENKNRDINIVTNIGTPLILACQQDHKEILEYLLSRNNLNLRLQDTDYNGGDTSFHVVCRNGNLVFLKLLLCKLKNLNSKKQSLILNMKNETDGRTAFMLACQWGHYDIIELLFTYEYEDGKRLLVVPDLEIKDKYGKTALDIVKERHYDDIIELIEFEKSWQSSAQHSRKSSSASFLHKESIDQIIESSKIESEMREELECPICWDYMEDTRIFICTNSHLFCESCFLDSNLRSCPKCREDFMFYPPKISPLAERWAKIVFKSN